MKKRIVVVVAVLMVSCIGMAGCQKKVNTVMPVTTESIAVPKTTEMEQSDFAIELKETRFIFETGKPITIYDLIEKVSSISEIVVAYLDMEHLDDTDEEETDDAVSEQTEEPFFTNYAFVLTNQPVLRYTNAGEYDNTITVTDMDGNSFSQEIHFIIADAPVITIRDTEISVGDEGALANFLASASVWDDEDGDLTASIVTESENINLWQAGTYPVTFSATNSKGITGCIQANLIVKEAEQAPADTPAGNSNTGNNSTGNNNTGNNDTGNNNTGNNAATNTPGDSGNSGNDTSSGNSNTDTSGGDTGGGENTTPTLPNDSSNGTGDGDSLNEGENGTGNGQNNPGTGDGNDDPEGGGMPAPEPDPVPRPDSPALPDDGMNETPNEGE